MDQQNFHPELEDIQQEFQQRIKAHEGGLTPEKEKDVLKQVIAEKFQAQPQTQTQAQTQAGDEQTDHKKTVPTVASVTNSQDQYQSTVDSLVHTVFEKGLSEAIKDVRGMGNAFLIDAFHDELVDKFYSEIKLKENA